MESKVTSLLTALSIAITTVVAAYLFTGPGYAIELTVVLPVFVEWGMLALVMAGIEESDPQQSVFFVASWRVAI